MNMRHPSARKLREWLDSGGPEKVDAHIATCETCAGKLENLAEPLPLLANALSRVLAPPVDLVPRLSTGIDDKLRNRADLALLASMLGLPIETARIVLTEEQD